MLSQAISASIRTAREAQGLSRADLAARAGVSVRLLAEVERGARPNVSLETALHLLQLLGVTLQPVGQPVAAADGSVAERQAMAARRAVRMATWVGRVGKLSDDDPPNAPPTVSSRIRAVREASELAYAVAAAHARAAQTTKSSRGTTASAAKAKRTPKGKR